MPFELPKFDKKDTGIELPKFGKAKTVAETLNVKPGDKIEIEANVKDETIEVQVVRESGFDTKKNKILKEYGELESNIPVNSPYWRMK